MCELIHAKSYFGVEQNEDGPRDILGQFEKPYPEIIIELGKADRTITSDGLFEYAWSYFAAFKNGDKLYPIEIISLELNTPRRKRTKWLVLLATVERADEIRKTLELALSVKMQAV